MSAVTVQKVRAGLGFRAGMMLPGAVVTLCLVIFALALVLFLSFRTNDSSLLGTGATFDNFRVIATGERSLVSG